MSSLAGDDLDPISSSGRGTNNQLNLTSLQSKMKSDPEGYKSELTLVYNQFRSSLELFQQQSALNFTSLSGIGADVTVAKELGDRAMFLAHVTPFYADGLSAFPRELAGFLESSARNIPSGLRFQVAQALILLVNRKIIDIAETLVVFMELQTVGDRALQKLAFSHVIQSIRRMNQKHKNDPNNRALQNILFGMLQQEDEAKAKRALITLCELHRRKLWFEERTANAICMACFHPSSRIMIAALSFLLDFEKIEDDDSDDSEDEEDQAIQEPQVVLNKESIYKATHKGTAASKKKKKAKLQRVIRSMKQQRLSSEKQNSNYYSPLNHLKDSQGFAEKVFSRLQNSNERFEVKMMMVKVIARTIGLYRLMLLNFYPYLQKYVQPHQRDVTSLLAAAVQACHDMVPPDAVEPLFKQIVNQFVHDRSRPEAISVGLNVVREICLRMPLLMTEDLLQDLVLYRKSHEKAVSSAARSLLTLFREICPSLLVKKDRGRPADVKAKPKAFGEVHVASNIPGIELLEQDDDSDSSEEIDETSVSVSHEDDEHVGLKDDDESNASDDDDANNLEEDEENVDEEADLQEINDNSEDGSDSDVHKLKANKRKFSDFEGELNVASKSLRALKKLAKVTSSTEEDRILSNEDFGRIKELKAVKDARATLTQHGFKLSSSDQLSMKRVDAAKLEDLGRPADVKAKPKTFGEVQAASNCLGIELLDQDDDSDSSKEVDETRVGVSHEDDERAGLKDDDERDASDGYSDRESDGTDEDNDGITAVTDSDDANDLEEDEENVEEEDEEADVQEINGNSEDGSDSDEDKSKAKKRKFSDFEGELNAASKSLHALKKLAKVTSNTEEDGILSNEDFERIKELKAKKDARAALTQHGFKLPSSDQLSMKRVDAAKLEANIKRKLTKDEKLALVRAGREERGKYQSRTAIKQKKTGGLTNRQKEHKKAMPLAAKRSKIAKTRIDKKKKNQRAGKQFRGRKAWKQ